jgi:hypothetical protein
MKEKQQHTPEEQVLPQEPQLLGSGWIVPVISPTLVMAQLVPQHSSVQVESPGIKPQSNSTRHTWPELPHVHWPPEQPFRVPQLLAALPELVTETEGWRNSCRSRIRQTGCGGDARNWPPEQSRPTQQALPQCAFVDVVVGVLAGVYGQVSQPVLSAQEPHAHWTLIWPLAPVADMRARSAELSLSRRCVAQA